MKHIFFCLIFLITGMQAQAQVWGTAFPPSGNWYSVTLPVFITKVSYTENEGKYFSIITAVSVADGSILAGDSVSFVGTGLKSNSISGLKPDTEYRIFHLFWQPGDTMWQFGGEVFKTHPLPPKPTISITEEPYLGTSDLLIKINSVYPVKFKGFYDKNYSVETEEFLHSGGTDSIIVPLTTPSAGKYPYCIFFEFSDSVSVFKDTVICGEIWVKNPDPLQAPAATVSNLEADCGTVSFRVQVIPVANDTASIKIYLSSNQLDWYIVDSAQGISQNSAFDVKIMGLSADTEFLIRVVATSKDGIADTTEKSVMMPVGEKPTLNITPRILTGKVEFNFAGFMGCDGGFLSLSVQGPSNFDTTIFVGAQSYSGTVSLELKSGDYFWEACVKNQHEVCKGGNFLIQGSVTSVIEQQKELVRNAISPSAQTLINDTLGRQIGSVLWGDIKNSEQNPLDLIGVYILFVPSSDYSEKRIFMK